MNDKKSGKLPHDDQYSKYDYLIDNPFWLRLRTIFALVALLLASAGNFWFYYQFPIFFPVFGLITVFTTIFFLISFGIIIFGYKKFDLEWHQVKTEIFKLSEQPTVDIFLPVCGEDLEVISNTWEGVLNLNYSNYKVYVLDDKGDAKLEKLAKVVGFNYLSRPNKGEMKKAGNLKYGFENSNGKFIVIFDADFRPHPDFLLDLLPYMQDNKVGIVQSPQHFVVTKELHKTNFLEYGACVVQEDFYRIIQTARDTFNGSICVGSNAIYRREALDLVGGTAQVQHSEDVHTGFSLLGLGYKIKYVPLVLAAGICPDNFNAFFKQQNRWCSGSMSLLQSKNFWTTNIPLITRLSYLSGMLYYVSNIFAFIMPLQVIFVIWLYSNGFKLENSLLFIPIVFFGFVLFPIFRLRPLKVGGIFVYFSQQYIYAYSVFLKLFLGKELGWIPSGNKMETSPELKLILKLGWFYVALLIFGAFILAINNKIHLDNYNTYFVIFWLFYGIITHIQFLLMSKRLIK